MIRDAMLVMAGGAAGSLLRFLVGMLLPAPTEGVRFPFATLAVNILGCLAIGMLGGLYARTIISSSLLLLLATGFCGGFTTFSAFSLEMLNFLRGGHYVLFVIYAGISLVLGIAAVWFAYRLSA